MESAINEFVKLAPEDCIKFSFTDTYTEDEYEVPAPDYKETTLMRVFTAYTYSGTRVCDIHVRERKVVDVFRKVTSSVTYAVSATFYRLFDIDFFDYADVILSKFKKQYPEINMNIIDDDIRRICKETEVTNDSTK